MTFSSPNICLHYRYRDGGNYKNNGAFVFSNPKQRSISSIDTFLKAHLINHLFFVAADWGVPDLHFAEYPYDETIDHDWHEYIGIEATSEAASEDLELFLARVEVSMNTA